MCSSTEIFKNRFLQASDNGISYDCKFIVGSENVVVEGHKFLFSVASEVFQAMFYGELKEDNAVKIEDLDADGFEGMKHFIYTGEVNFTSAIHALSTYIAARKYLISELTKECIKYIQNEIEPSEVLEFYECCETNNIPEFDDLCLKVIEERTDEVIASEYCPSAKIETIELILKSRSLNLKSEIKVFDIFEKWALAEAARKQISDRELASCFKNLKKYIRFLTMSSEEFTSHIEQSSLLTQAEKRAIECNLLKLYSKPMPQNLSVIQQQRSYLSTLETVEEYKYSHTFVVSLDRFCDPCNRINIYDSGFDLYLKLTILNNKYLCLLVTPEENRRKSQLFNMKTKLLVFSVDECHDLTFRNQCRILQKPSKEQSEVFIAEIPLDKLDDKFFPRGTKRTVIIKVQFNIMEINI